MKYSDLKGRTDLVGRKVKEIEDYPGYFVTDAGEVFGRKKLAQRVRRTGYLYVELYKNGKKCQKNVHRFIALAFIEKIKGKPWVNHKNGVKTDNRIENLEWCTPSENAIHAVQVLNRPTFSKKIVQKDMEGNVIKVWDSGRAAGRALGICFGNISTCTKGTKRRQKAGGFLWEKVVEEKLGHKVEIVE